MIRIINFKEKTYIYTKLKIYCDIKNFNFSDYLTHEIELISDTDMYRPNKEYLYTKYEAHCKECGIYILHIIYKNDYKNHFYIFNKEKMEITSNVTINNKLIKCKDIIIKNIIE